MKGLGESPPLYLDLLRKNVAARRMQAPTPNQINRGSSSAGWRGGFPDGFDELIAENAAAGYVLTKYLQTITRLADD